jgi:hypothetical protein
MKKKSIDKAAIVGFSALVIIVLMLLIVPGSSAYDPPPYVGIRSGTNICLMLDGSNPPNEIDYVSSSEAKIEGENGTNGTILLQCNSSTDQSDLQSQEKWNFDNTGRQCEVVTPDGAGSSTVDWNIVVSASGNIKLTCHFGDQHD